MAFMQPVAERMVMYHVETNVGTELVPEDVCSKLDCEVCERTGKVCSETEDALSPYLEGSEIQSVTRKEGWYARLSAPGYLDATDWHGPFKTADAALADVKDLYEVDDEGNDLDDDPSQVR
jgi:hypothetical protein